MNNNSTSQGGFLEDNKLTSGFGPDQFPNLIISNKYCLLKGNGMPYIAPVSDNSWPFYNSSSNKPVLHLLELIWSRLAYRFDLKAEIFGEDLEIEGVNTFLKCNIVNVNGTRGWHYEYPVISKKEFKKPQADEKWEPVKITNEQHHVVAHLCKHGSIKLTRMNWLINGLGKQLDTDDLIKSLIETHLVYIDSCKELRLLTDHCKCLYYPEIGYLAADDRTGKFTRWLEKKMKKKIENILHISFS